MTAWLQSGVRAGFAEVRVRVRVTHELFPKSNFYLVIEKNEIKTQRRSHTYDAVSCA